MEDNKKPVKVTIDENSFELSLRILSNEFVAIKIGSTNFSGKLIAGGIQNTDSTMMQLLK